MLGPVLRAPCSRPPPAAGPLRWRQRQGAAASPAQSPGCRRCPRRIACGASEAEEPGPSNADDTDKELAKAKEQLIRSLSASISITGKELRQLVWDKWGRSYDVRLQRRGRRLYLHVMWKHLEQQSFPLTEEEYQAQLDAVAEYLSMWGVADVVRAGIRGANSRGPGYTGGGSARAISIPLGVDVDGARSGEWNTFLS